MGLYNMLFGVNDRADVLLACLGYTRGDVGRFRDCYIDGEHIVIHTRNGGGNRDEYQVVIDQLASHPDYVRDEDCDYDCTYADIYFRFPEAHAQLLREIAAADGEQPTPAEKWDALLTALWAAPPAAEEV